MGRKIKGTMSYPVKSDVEHLNAILLRVLSAQRALKNEGDNITPGLRDFVKGQIASDKGEFRKFVENRAIMVDETKSFETGAIVLYPPDLS